MLQHVGSAGPRRLHREPITDIVNAGRPSSCRGAQACIAATSAGLPNGGSDVKRAFGPDIYASADLEGRRTLVFSAGSEMAYRARRR